MAREPGGKEVRRRKISAQGVVWAIAVLLGLGAIIWLMWPVIHPTAPAPEAAPDNITVEAPPPATPDDDDARASAAAFDPSGVLKPQKVVQIGTHFAVIAVGAVADASHIDSGTLAVQYVDRNGNGFAPFGQRVMEQAGSTGQIGGWTLRRDLGTDPLIALTGGGTWQGCTVSSVQFIALSADGPHTVSDPIPISYDDSGAVDSAQPAYTGTISSAGMDPDAGAGAADLIEVTYTGGVNSVIRFHRENGRLVPDAPLPTGC